MPVPRGTKLRLNYWQKMGYKVILRPKAELDLEDAYDWYENQLKGLGADLLEKVDDSLNIIKENPKIFPIIHKKIRRALIHRFPYGIFYFTGNDLIIVSAIFHAKREPQKWENRI